MNIISQVELTVYVELFSTFFDNLTKNTDHRI